jgi:tRNA A-37 threonylcarbamoyl transferase component Bud32
MTKEKAILSAQDTKALQLPGMMMLPDGTKPVKLGSGTISSLISAGGAAVVYEVWNAELEVKRAVKLLKPDHSNESEERFRTEMKISAKLHHPNIVEIYTVGTWNDLPFIEMELIDGITIEKLIEESGGLPPEVCTSIGIMVGRALNYAHSQSYVLYGKRYVGVIHRDLKPGNIMVTHDGIAKLMDFGIAKPVTATTRTLEGMVMGTMQYLAPEQLDGKEIDVRADIYSLGTVLYEIATGVRAFPEQKLGKLVTDKLNNSYTPLNDFSARVPSALIGLIHRCIRTEKEKRVQDSVEFLRAVCRVHKTLTLKAPEQVLEQFLKTRDKSKRIADVRKKTITSRSVVWSAFVLACAALATFVALWLNSSSGRALFLGRDAGVAVAPAEGGRIDSTPAPQRASSAVELTAADSLAFDSLFDMGDDIPAVKTEVPSRKTRSPTRPSPQAAAPAPSVGAPVPPPAAPHQLSPQPLSPQELVERLKQQLGTSDLMTIFSAEIEAGHFANGLLLYPMLSPEQANSRKALLYKLRALRATGDKNGAKYILFGNEIKDGEFYLEKARWYFITKDYNTANEFVHQAVISPAQYLDPRKFRETLLYSKALCASALYDASPTPAKKKETMEAWYDVKSLFKLSPDHKYFIKADAELRRISTGLSLKK